VRYSARSNKAVTVGTDLTALNTLQLHATAQHLITVASSDQLQTEIAALDEGAGPHVLGGGSNVILCDHCPGQHC
jgi:UDP-N-acetylenolpyruvoylglucosamine reductase